MVERAAQTGEVLDDGDVMPQQRGVHWASRAIRAVDRIDVERVDAGTSHTGSDERIGRRRCEVWMRIEVRRRREMAAVVCADFRGPETSPVAIDRTCGFRRPMIKVPFATVSPEGESP